MVDVYGYLCAYRAMKELLDEVNVYARDDGF